MKTQAEILHENITELSEKVDGFADAINTSLETVVDKTESIVVDLNQTYARLNEIDDTIANINTDVKVDVDLEELKEYIPEKTTQLVVEELSSKLDTLINAQKQTAIREYGAINYYYSLIEDRPEIVEFVNSLSSYETIEDKIEAIASIIENTNVSEILEGIELSQSSIDMINICNDGTFGLKKTARFSPGADGNSKAVQDVLRQLLDAGKNEAAKLSDKITKDNICSVVAEALRKLFNEKRKFAKNYTKNVHDAVKSMLTELNKKCNDYYENHKDDVEDLVSDDGPKPGCCTDLNSINESIMQLLVVVANYPVFFKRPDLSFGECLTSENVDKVVRYWESDTNNVVTSNFPDTSNLKRLKNDVKAYIESLNADVYDTVRCGGGNSEATWGTDANYIEQSTVQLTNPPNSDGTQTNCDSKEKISTFLNKWQTYIQNLHNGIHKEPIIINFLNINASANNCNSSITFCMNKKSPLYDDDTENAYTVDDIIYGIGYLDNYKKRCEHSDNYNSGGFNVQTVVVSEHSRSFSSMDKYLLKKAQNGIVSNAKNKREELENFKTKINAIPLFYHSWIYNVTYGLDIICTTDIILNGEAEKKTLYHNAAVGDYETTNAIASTKAYGEFSDIHDESIKNKILNRLKAKISSECNNINAILKANNPILTPLIDKEAVISNIDKDAYYIAYDHLAYSKIGNYIYQFKGNELKGPDFYTDEELTNEKWNSILNGLHKEYKDDYILDPPTEKPASYQSDSKGNKYWELSWNMNPRTLVICRHLLKKLPTGDQVKETDPCNGDTLVTYNFSGSHNSSEFWQQTSFSYKLDTTKWQNLMNEIAKNYNDFEYENKHKTIYENSTEYYYKKTLDESCNNCFLSKPNLTNAKAYLFFGKYIYKPRNEDINIEWKKLDEFCGGVKLWIDYEHSLIYNHIHCGGVIEGPYLNGEPLNAADYENATGQKLKDAYIDSYGNITRFSVGPGELIDVSDNDEGVCYTLKVQLPGGTGSFPANIPALEGKTFEIKWKAVGGTNSKKLIEESGIQYAIVNLVRDTKGDFQSGKCTCNLDLELEEPEY